MEGGLRRCWNLEEEFEVFCIGAGDEGDEEGFSMDEVEEDDEEGDEEEIDEDDDALHSCDGKEAAVPRDVEIYDLSANFNYEALAERKRRALLEKPSEEPSKRPRFDECFGATAEEIEELMQFGSRRRRRRRGTKKKGRKSGSKNKLSPEIMRNVSEATLCYAAGEFDKAIAILREVVRVAPHFSESYSMLGRIYEETGDRERALNAHIIAARVSPRNPCLWKKLLVLSIKEGKSGLYKESLARAVTADPKDLNLRFDRAALFFELGDYLKAAQLYDKILEHYPSNITACNMAAKLYEKCGQLERAIGILKDYINNYLSKDVFSALTLYINLLMENGKHLEALNQIEHASKSVYGTEELPLLLKAMAVICNAHLGNVIDEENFFRDLQLLDHNNFGGVIAEVADSFKKLEYFDFALKYYCLMENMPNNDMEDLHLRIAECYVSNSECVKAIPYFYKALSSKENDIDTRLTLSSILLEEGMEDEAIKLLSPPMNADSSSNSLTSYCWWLNGKVRLKLAKIYQAKGMIKEFIDAIFSCIKETLCIEIENQKIKEKRRLTIDVLVERAKLLDDASAEDVVLGSKPIAPASELAKASRARKSLQKMETFDLEKKLKETAKSDCLGDDSDDEPPRKVAKEPPLTGFMKDDEHYDLIISLSKALASLKQHSKALEIIILALKLPNNILSPHRKEELRAFGVQIAYNTDEPENGYDLAKNIVRLHPYSMTAWNCYYKIVSRFEGQESQVRRHMKFLRHMRRADKGLVPPLVMMGHHFNSLNQHQAAARVYLEAHKLLPDDPLINLCVGTSLINLALGFRLQNKHYCAAQGLAFLYRSRQTQEGLYNLARAFHLLGLVTLAASYYEKVLATKVEDHPVPVFPFQENPEAKMSENLQSSSGHCSLHREAAYNLHLIYKKSGADDLARQILKDYCCP